MAQASVSIDSDVFPDDITATQRVLRKIAASFPQYSAVLETTPTTVHRLNPNRDNAEGSYDTNTGNIDINHAANASYNSNDFGFTFLHEIQHARNATARDDQFDREQKQVGNPTYTLEPNFAMTRMTGNLSGDRLQQVKNTAAKLGFPSSNDDMTNISTEELMATLVPGMDNAYNGHPMDSSTTARVDALHSMYPNTVNALFFADRNPEIQSGQHYQMPRANTMGPIGAILDSVLGPRIIDPSSIQPPPDDNISTDATIKISPPVAPVMEQTGTGK